MKNGDPIKLNFEGLKTQKRNTATTRTQKKKKKNGVICPDITLTPAVMVIKCQK